MSNHANIKTSADLAAHFRAYLRIINAQAWSSLNYYVAPRLQHNGRQVTLRSFSNLIPRGTHHPDTLVADVVNRTIAARIDLELPSHVAYPGGAGTPGGKPQRMHAHIFYRYNKNWHVEEIWSLYSDPAWEAFVRAGGVGGSPTPSSPQSPRTSASPVVQTPASERSAYLDMSAQIA